MRRTFYQKHEAFFSKFHGLLFDNPVLGRGLVLAPVIVASYNYRNSLLLGLSFLCITFVTVMLSSFIPKKIPYTLRTILYLLISSLVFIPTAIWMNQLFPDSVTKVGVFLPLLIANSLIVVKSESRFHKSRKKIMVIDLISHCLGFLWVILLVGMIREFLGSGSIFGVPIPGMPAAPAVLMPFSGFILVGFLAAAVKSFRMRLEHPRKRKKSQEIS